jgi:hypothetical protein
VAVVQESGVDRVDVSLQRLHVVALDHALADYTLGREVALELGQGRYFRGSSRPHVRPDDAVALHTRVSDGAYLALEIAFGGLRGHVDTSTRHVELPAVIDAAQPVLFVAAEE